MAECSCGAEPRVAATLEPFDVGYPVPAYPPSTWFTERPEWLTPETKIGVDDLGRVAGYFYNAGQCLVHNAAACPTPSPTGYAAFHQQGVMTEDGTELAVGVIGNVNGHANEYAPVTVAMAHYADPDRQIISCRAYDDEHGGYILGSMVPHATYGDVALVRRSALSGDWRPMPDAWWEAHGITASLVRQCEGFDCIGPTLVTRPGLPLVRRFAAAMLGGAGGVQIDEEEPVSAETVIDLGNGVKITTTQPELFTGLVPGPHPVEALTAAPFVKGQAPPTKGGGAPASNGGPPPAPASGGPADQGGGDVSARLDALEQDVAAIKQVVGQLVQELTSSMASVLPPERAITGAVTKSEGGKNFPASDYAYVPDTTKPTTWKLRLTSTPGGTPDPAIVGAAAAALGPGGHRGQPVDIPAGDRAAVKAKVRSAWKKANPDKTDADMPAQLKG